MLTSSFLFVNRARSLGLTAVVRSGVMEVVDQLFHLRKPVDPMALHDWLAQDWAALASATARIRLLGDDQLVWLSSAMTSSSSARAYWNSPHR